MNIPDEAVEAAAKMHQATCFAEPWESLSDFLRSERLEDAKLILEAAAPIMRQAFYLEMNLRAVKDELNTPLQLGRATHGND